MAAPFEGARGAIVGAYVIVRFTSRIIRAAGWEGDAVERTAAVCHVAKNISRLVARRRTGRSR